MKNIPLKDTHIHINEEFPDERADGFAWPDASNAENLLDYMDAAGYAAAVLPAITLYKAEDLVSNPLALLTKILAEKRGKEVWALAGMRRFAEREKNADMANQAKTLMSCGFDGFKFICKPTAREVMRFGLNDAVFDEFFALAEQEQWPILYHVADPADFWDPARVPARAKEQGWYYGDSKIVPPYRAFYDEAEDVLRRFPRLRVVFAHFFFLSDDLDRAAYFLDTYPNILFDVTPGREMYVNFTADRPRARAFFQKYIDRFLFGTDVILYPDAQRAEKKPHYLKKTEGLRRFFETEDEFLFRGLPVQGIALCDADLHKLYHENAERFYGYRTPARVDRARAAALVREYIGYLPADLQNSPVQDNLRAILAAIETR